ncbi:MAG: XRE family transcriptional regulator [Legionellales bacterium]|nr:XRE family transcriptional regulator [Legionellales bacterium]
MKNQSINSDEIWEQGSENVFADLDMPDAEEKLAKAELAFKINQLLKRKKLKQAEAAEILHADQSKISLLNRGRLSSFSIERLVRYLNLLNQDVEIVIKRSSSRKKQGKLRVVYL